MMERDVCDRPYPPRWRSTVAVFAYEPPEEQQTYPEHIVSYLKVSCSITGVQPGAEIGAAHPGAAAAFNDVRVVEAYDSVVDRYYGCYGALLEVAVKPQLPGDAADQIPLSQFPYFIDVEPKKREVIETVTETGERLTRSESAVNVRKGTTTTEGHEVVDTDTWGVTGGASVGVANLGGFYSSSSGTKDMTGQQHENIRTTDRARELRELYSHQTQLAQMYHQFTAYHVGTNRAVFVMLPRPHIVQSEHTFVAGPRMLEGIQDVLLVMMRPKNMPQVCVEAYLETAHLAFQENVYDSRTESVEHTVNEAVANKGENRTYQIEYVLPVGWELDDTREQTFSVSKVGSTNPNQPATSPIIDSRLVSYDEGKLVVEVTLGTLGKAGVFHYLYYAELVLTVYLRRIGQEPTDVPRDLYLTGRGVCCCPGLPAERPEHEPTHKATAVLIEESLPPEPPVYAVGRRSGMRVYAANRLRERVGTWLVRSVNSPRRYARGSVTFLESRLLAERVADVLDLPDHEDNTAVRDIAGLPAELAEAVTAAMPWLRRADLLRMSLAELGDRFELSPEQAVTLRRAALGLLAPLDEPRRRWPAPPRPEVPDLVGLHVDEARAALIEQRLRLGAVTERDGEQPQRTVLEQRPEAGVVATPDVAVDVVVATGLTVRIPDVVGRGVSEALCLLRDAGLRSEPELVFVARPGRRRHTVLEAEPRPRTHVTPHARVVLQVVSGEPGRGGEPG
jgi:hypothetical protein